MAHCDMDVAFENPAFFAKRCRVKMKTLSRKKPFDDVSLVFMFPCFRYQSCADRKTLQHLIYAKSLKRENRSLNLTGLKEFFKKILRILKEFIHVALKYEIL